MAVVVHAHNSATFASKTLCAFMCTGPQAVSYSVISLTKYKEVNDVSEQSISQRLLWCACAAMNELTWHKVKPVGNTCTDKSATARNCDASLAGRKASGPAWTH